MGTVKARVRRQLWFAGMARDSAGPEVPLVAMATGAGAARNVQFPW